MKKTDKQKTDKQKIDKKIDFTYKVLNKKERKNLNNAIVRIIAINTGLDWKSPFKISEANESVGTGFFISKKGLLLTCFHVIDDAIKIYINIPDEGKKRYIAKIICVCPKLDLALLTVVDYKPKQLIEIGNSDLVRPGDKVKALGYPLGHEHIKFTAGVISGRQQGDIQTDTPINPGNSGGPLLNEKNEVIGINSSGIAAHAADNIGFAIPIYNVYVLLKRKKNKLICTPFFGCRFINCNEDYFNNVGIQDVKDIGVVISEIVEETPISKTGIEEGDILLRFDNMLIDNYNECKVSWSSEKESLSDILKRYTVYDKVPISYFSIKKNKVITTTLNFSNYTKLNIRTFFPKFEKIDYEIFGGIIIMELCSNHLALFEGAPIINLVKYNLLKNKKEKKLIIVNILSGSSISKSENIVKGDLIQEINKKTPQTLTELRELLSPLSKESFFHMKTELGNIVTISMKNIIKDEKFLSKEYNYKISELMQKKMK